MAEISAWRVPDLSPPRRKAGLVRKTERVWSHAFCVPQNIAHAPANHNSFHRRRGRTMNSIKDETPGRRRKPWHCQEWSRRITKSMS